VGGGATVVGASVGGGVGGGVGTTTSVVAGRVSVVASAGVVSGNVSVVATTGVVAATVAFGSASATSFAVVQPAAVIADRQTGGRGRRGAAWWQPTGSLAASLVLDGSAVAGGVTPIWSLACGVALAETVRDLEPAAAARVRWPNDVEVAGRKLAGILVETAADGLVRGLVGVRDPAAHLSRMHGRIVVEAEGRDLWRAWR
jgi:hypothetical protein